MHPRCVSLRAVASIRRVLRLLGCSLALSPALGCTRAYLQNEGDYELTAVEVLRDDCSLLASPESLWDGSLVITGEVVRMNMDWMDLQLIGRFLDGGPEDNDAFELDGSLTNAAVTVRGQACLLDQVAVHLEATTQCATRFDGVLRVHFEPQPEQPECGCQLWVSYRAVQNSLSCESAP